MLKSILGNTTKQINVIKRMSGEKFVEKIYGEDAMKVFYGSAAGAAFTEKFLTNKWISNIYGAYNDSGASKHKIEEFVNLMGINVSESEKDISEYNSFNDFFARKLHPRARPINRVATGVNSPGDGRLLVFPKITDSTLSYVKWAPIKLIELFNGNESLAERYKNGSCGILRLCPSDYHRFHFPVSGKAGITKTVPGLLHSVNPYALEHKISVYCLNKRTICELDSDNFGKVLLMEVGALFVGTIVQTYRPGMQVEKGDEKGFFKFGGSTCIFFFEHGIMKFDEDLIQASNEGFETLVHIGEKIGTLSEGKVDAER
ncbi:archaetidylserine decarboxylase [Silvanigrella sp.]|jgi:phosphatidylserine decarboxylase|uniref:archaetidylserine decarboxylase n=1 Tax=Silvanigrella sp. TaxID=2024976 RepID=UPI0037CBB89F